MSTGGTLRYPLNRCEMRVRDTSSAASKGFNGGKATAQSRMRSTAVPPWPKSITGPNTESLAAPRMSSNAVRLVTMRWTENPSIRASGARSRTVFTIASATARTCSSERRSSATPPASDLCEISGETIFSATGKPRSRAARIADSASGAVRVSTTGMPYAASTPLASCACSSVRPSCRAVSIMRRAARLSGAISGLTDGGVCISSA
ncbi:hypothetical protein D3C86_1625980 [compost metagenome]